MEDRHETVLLQDKLVSIKEFRKIGQQIVNSIEKVVVITINIKNFKYFNQVYGFESGDKVLDTLKTHFCNNFEACKVAAFTYADHLSLIAEEYDIACEDVVGYIRNMCGEFTENIYKEFPLARIHLDCGIYFADDIDEDFEDMRDKARFARKSINDNYNDVVAVYDEDLGSKSMREAGVVPLFEYAMENDKVQLYLQPKFTIDTQEMVGAEVLSRIEDVEGNTLAPGVYVPVLEKTGLISMLDKRMVELIIEKIKKWEKEGLKVPKVSINLSRVDFTVPGFIAHIDEMIEESGLEKDYFEFELTETLFCENLNHIIEKINMIRSKGYKISMDDFGSGYNSLYVLGMVPIDVIKFDRGFVVNSLHNDKGFAIMSSLVDTFSKSKFDIVCEGVETKEEERMVRETGCNVIQGYLHDKPIPADKFEEKYLRD